MTISKCLATSDLASARAIFTLFGCVAWTLVGCGKPTSNAVTADASNDSAAATVATVDLSPQSYEADGDQLLAARLPLEQTSQGWIRLFDGHTLFGWEITGRANWRIEEGSLVVDQGEKGFLCTSVPWQDYELTLEFNADERTNSGVFLRTPLNPEDPAIDCYEVNIAPADNPFPTASVVKRQKVDVEKAPATTPGAWQRMTMRLEGSRLQVTLGDVLVTDYVDPMGLEPGRISLQHNEGRVAFRDIRLRPLGLENMVDEKLSQWKRYPEMSGEFTVVDGNAIHVNGGKTQLESTAEYKDFVLLTDFKTAAPATNTGLFFRCIPGEEMQGYECQVNNEMVDSMPLVPADCGTGGIFRRQNARVITGYPEGWSSLLLVVNGPKMAAWVNGVQVSDWQDDRKPDPNPRKGKRLEAGTLMIQGHDPETKAWFKDLSVREITTVTTSAETAKPEAP